jgi:hypothetical protein
MPTKMPNGAKDSELKHCRWNWRMQKRLQRLRQAKQELEEEAKK